MPQGVRGAGWMAGGLSLAVEGEGLSAAACPGWPGSWTRRSRGHLGRSRGQVWFSSHSVAQCPFSLNLLGRPIWCQVPAGQEWAWGFMV